MRSALILLLLLASPLHADEAAKTDDAVSVEENGELTFDDLFRAAAIHTVSLSPDGELIAFFRSHMLVIGQPGKGYFDVRKFHDRLSIEDLDWIGPKTVWVTSWDSRNQRYLGTAVRFSNLGEEGYEVDDVRDHRNPGYITDRLPNVDNLIVLARPRLEDDSLASDLYTIDVFQPLDEQLKKANRVDTGSEDFFYYQKNPAGEYTLGIGIKEGVPEIWSRSPEDDSWEHVWSGDKESSFLPWQISHDAKTLWVLSDALTERIAAVKFDLERREFGEILFEHDRVDVDSILMDEDGSAAIGVIYTEQGLLRYHFFSEEHNAEFEQVKGHFPGQGIMLIGYAEEANTRLVFASSQSERGSIHVCRLANNHCDLVESIAPWMEGKPLRETIPLSVPSTDGLVVDAFLTLPEDVSDSVPLIALPHGGPIGVSDDRYFSSEVQWLALNGYAVLQVNYRGSGGYGEKFMRAGLRQWGRGIEDDIEAAVNKVLQNYPQIDGERVGIFGGSYGGYSAIMSTVRNPDLFKCAASFAGVMDLTLLFTESAVKRSDFVRETLIEFVGDPDVNYDELTEHSPVYRYKDITRPILLGHGMDDSVVDYEHSWRLQKMMRLNGSAPQFILLKNVGHGFSYINQARDFYEPLIDFLDKHLKPEPKPVADPSS